MDEEASYVFFYLDSARFPCFHSKPTQELLGKWGFSAIQMSKFRFDRPFNSMSSRDFLKDLVNSAEVRRCFPPINSAAKVEVVSDVQFTELKVRLISMDLFDRLQETGKVDASGSIRKMIPDYIDGIEVADRVREVLLMEESEDYGLFSADERSEFLFHIFKHLVLGGGLCQYEDEIGPYLDTAKNVYKDLVAVGKDQTSEELRVLSRVYELQGNSDFLPFPEFHPQNFLYVAVDPSYRHVNLWWNKWQSAWT